MSKGIKVYAAITSTGSIVCNTWDEVLAFLKEHPGKEFHKKFATIEAASEFLDLKQAEFGEEPIARDTFASPICVVPSPKEATDVSTNVVEDGDDEPPW